MELLRQVRIKIARLHDCDSGYLLAHAAWSACDMRKLAGPSALDISSSLDSQNTHLVQRLFNITSEPDYSNADQYQMLHWLHENGFSGYIAKQLKTTKKKLVDWE